MQGIRLTQQGRPAPVAVDGLGRAAEVEVHCRRAELCQQCGIMAEPVRVGAEQLRMHRHACGGLPAVQAFRHDPPDAADIELPLRHADEFADTAVYAADAGEDVTHGGIHQPFHGRENDAVLHGLMPCSASRARSPASSMTVTPSCSALASLLPAPGPATTQCVFAETLPATLAPRPSRCSLATSREKASSVPVSTQVWPLS